MENTPIQLDGAPFEKAVQPLLTSLQELRRLLIAVNSTPTDNLRKEMQALKVSAVTVVGDVEAALKKVPALMRQELAQAVKGTKQQMSQAGKEAGKGFVDGAVESVRQQRQRLQAEYEAMAAMGRIKLPILQEAKARGVSLNSADRLRLEGFNNAAKASADTLSVRRRLAKVELSELTAHENLMARTIASFNASRQKLTSDASREDQKGANLAFKTRQSLAKSEQSQSAAELSDLQKSSNLTYRARQSALRAERLQAAERIAALGRESQAILAASSFNGIGLSTVSKGANIGKVLDPASDAENLRAGVLLKQRKKLHTEELSDLANLTSQKDSANARLLANLAKNEREQVAGVGKYDVLLKSRKKLQAEEVADLNKLASGVESANNRLIANLAKAGKDRQDLRAKSAGNIDPRTLLNLQPLLAVKSARGSADVFKERFAEEEKGTLSLAKATRLSAAETKLKTKEQYSLADALNSSHSAARGLASGFGAMWLTWGQIGPLLAGAAISNGLVQAINAGSQFEQSLAAIRFLGGESEAAVEGIGKAALEMARNGPVGPLEIAEAFKTLSLAGLDAKQQMEAIKPVMNFSLAGEMEIKKAAETLTAISTSFGYSALGFGAVSDVITKAAAISMSSVADMAEAFKQASTVSQQFGVSINDAATSLIFLSQVGIKGSAAGTAMRNMYNELMGSSKQARQILKETLKIDIVDNFTKAVKPLPVIFGDLSKSLSGLTFEAQLQALQKLGNERGLKAISANLTAFFKAAKDGGKDAATEMQRIQQLLEDAPGFAAQAAVGMALTSQGQMKAVGATLQATLIEAFQAIQPEVVQVSQAIKEVFNSQEFKGGLNSMLTGLAQLAQFLIEHLEVLKALALGYLLGKGAQLAFAASSALAAVSTGVLSSAMAFAGVTATRAALAMTLFQASLGPIGLLLAGATAAYMLFGKSKETESQRITRATKAHSDATLEGLTKEEDRLKAQMKARKEGIDANLAGYTVEARLAQSRLETLHSEALAADQTAHSQLLLARARVGNTEFANTAQGAKALQQMDAGLDASRQKIAAGVISRLEAENALRLKNSSVMSLAKEDRRQADEEARASRNIKTGKGVLPEDPGAASGVKLQAEKSELKNLQNAYGLFFQDLEQKEKEKQNKLRYLADIGLVSEAEFHKKSLQQSEEFGARKLELLATQEAAVEAQLKVIQAARNAKKEDPANQALADAEEGAARTAMAKIKAQIADDREQMSRQSRVRALKAGTNIIDNSEQELTISAANLKQELEKLDVKNNLNQLSERDQFIAGETLRILGAQQDMLVKQEAIRARIVLDNGLDKLNDPNNGLSEEERQQLTEHLAKLDASIAKTKAALASAGDQVREATAKAFDAKRIDDFAKHLNTNLVDALMSGGKEGGKAFRDYIQNELLRKNFRMVVSVLLEPITKGIASTVMGAVGGSGGSGSGLLGMASNVSSLYSGVGNMVSMGSQVYAGTMSAANALGTIAANTTGTGLSGLLATNGAYGTAATLAATTTATTAQAAIAANVAMAAGTAPALAAGTTAAAAGTTAAAGTGAASALAAIPVYGWIALAAVAAYAAFGGKGKKEVTSSGVVGNLSASGLSGNSFQNYTQKGGWFSSNSSGQDTAALTSAQANAFTGNFLALRSAATNASTALGASATVLENYSQRIYLEDGADMAAFFAKLGDNMTNVAAPGVFAFAKAGEAATATLSRLATALTSVNPVLSKLGQITMQISLMGADASSKLIDLFGGLENFGSSAQSFYETFYTGADKLADSQQVISKAFGSLNLTVPKTKQEFKLLTQGLNLSTEAGRTAYATLLQLAPTFATVTEELTAKSAEVADKLVKTFLGAKGIVPALLASDLVVGELGTTLVSTASAAGFISTLFLDLSSGLISFGSAQTGTVSGLSKSQVSAKKLNAQLADLRANAEDAKIDIAGLSLALRDVDLETFQSAVGQVFETLASRISKTVSTISNERISLREAALNIIGAGPLGKSEITQGITEASAFGNSGVTSNSALLAAKQALTVSDTAAAQQKAVVDQLRTFQPGTAGVDAASAKLGSANNTLASAQSGVDQFRGFRNGSFDFYLNAALNGQDYRGSLPGPNSRNAGEYNAQTVGFNYRDAQAGVQQAQTAYQKELADYNALVTENSQRVSAAQALLGQAQTQQSAALTLARQAQLDYVADLQTFSVEAGRSAEKLGALREETVKYYEAQKQLSDLMKNSAAGLRGTVDSFRTAQMTPEQQFASAQQKFSTAYSMALSTDGSALVGYADKLNEMLNPLLESARDIYSTEGEYNSFAATMLARAENVATRLDTLAPTDFVADSLEMLQSIDGALALLGTASQSAEKIISDAITAGSDKTANGLRAVIAALSGQPIPAFASGGNFPGGIRLVGENGPELEVTGASKIFNATQTRDLMSGGSSSAVSAALVAEIRGLRQEVSDLRVEARATAVNTGKLSRLADRADQDGMLVRTDSDTSLRTTAVI